MIRQGLLLFIILLLVSTLSGCLGTLWSGARLVYDRHNVYKKLNDYHLLAEVTHVLYADKLLKNNDCVLDLAVFNGDILLAGHLPSTQLLQIMQQRLQTIKNYRRFFKEVIVSEAPSTAVQDSWITTKIRSQIFADSSIDPNAFKILTTDRIVYIMGDVKLEEAKKVVSIARFTKGVERVVKLMKYSWTSDFTAYPAQTNGNEIAKRL